MIHNLLEVANDWEVCVISKGDDLLMDHKSKDSHHGGTAVVELDSTLAQFLQYKIAQRWMSGCHGR